MTSGVCGSLSRDGQVEINGFAVRNGKQVARGTARAELLDRSSGQRFVVNQSVTLSATKKGSCRILDLDLEELNLRLLGLEARLDRVTLSVTGSRRGGVLGKLFCKLADADVGRLGLNKANRSFARHFGKRPLRPISFSVPVRPVAVRSQQGQPAPGECPVLDLIVGPLDLDLLGLIVKLNKVKLTVVARRGQGAVGEKFCDLQ